MRTLQRNKSSLKYANEEGKRAKTKTDKYGNVIKTGDEEIYYSAPTPFKVNISMSGGEAEAVEYGLNLADYGAKLVLAKGTVPIKEGSLIWYETEPTTDIEGHGLKDSADYIVKKYSPSLNVDKYILQRLTHGNQT